VIEDPPLGPDVLVPKKMLEQLGPDVLHELRSINRNHGTAVDWYRVCWTPPRAA
jgi:hypothetical protein